MSCVWECCEPGESCSHWVPYCWEIVTVDFTSLGRTQAHFFGPMRLNGNVMAVVRILGEKHLRSVHPSRLIQPEKQPLRREAVEATKKKKMRVHYG